jgi:hypothetical protein
MLSSGCDQDTGGLGHQDLAKPDHFAQIAGPREDPRVGRHPDHSTQHLRRHTVARVAIDDFIYPASAKIVIGRIGSESLNKNIDIGKDHRVAIRSSRSLDRFRSTPGRVPPNALETGKRASVRGLAAVWARIRTGVGHRPDGDLSDLDRPRATGSDCRHPDLSELLPGEGSREVRGTERPGCICERN